MHQLFLDITDQKKCLQDCYNKDEFRRTLTTYATDIMEILRDQPKRSQAMNELLCSCRVVLQQYTPSKVQKRLLFDK